MTLSECDRETVTLQQETGKATGHFEMCFQREYITQDIYKNSISVKNLEVQGLPPM